MPDDQFIKIHTPFCSFVMLPEPGTKTDQATSDTSTHASCRLATYKQTADCGAAMTEQLPKWFRLLLSAVLIRAECPC